MKIDKMSTNIKRRGERRQDEKRAHVMRGDKRL